MDSYSAYERERRLNEERLRRLYANSQRVASLNTQLNRSKPQAAPPQQSFFNKVRDVFDANTPSDVYRRQQAGQAANYAQQQKDRGIGRIANNPWERVLNTGKSVGETITDPYKKIGTGLSTAFGEGAKLRAYQEANQKENLANIESLQKQLQAPTTSLADRAKIRSRLAIAGRNRDIQFGNQMGEFKRLQQDADPLKMAGSIAQAGTDLAGLGIAGFAGKEFGTNLAKFGFREAAKRAIPAVGTNAALNTVQGGIGELQSDNPTIAGAARKAGLGLTIGTAADLVVGGLPAFMSNRAYKNAVKDLTGESDSLVIRDTLKSISKDLPEERINTIAKEIADTTDETAVDGILKKAAREEADLVSGNVSNIDIPATKPVTTTTDTVLSEDVVKAFTGTKTPQQVRDSINALFPELDETTKVRITQEIAKSTDEKTTRQILEQAQAQRKALTEGVQNVTPQAEALPPTQEQQIAQAAEEQSQAQLTSNQAPDPNIEANQVGQQLDQAGQPVKAVQGVSASDATVVPDTVTNADRLQGEIQKQFVDKDAPYINYLKKVEKETGQTGLVDQFYYDSGLQRRSNSIANSTANNSENLTQAFGGLTGQSKTDFDRYVELRNEIANANRGLKTAEKLDSLIAQEQALAPQYGSRFESLNNYYKEWATKLREGGLIDEPTYQSFVQNNDYTHIQRVMDDLAGYSGGSGNAMSLGSTKARLKRTGSERAIQPADITALNYGQKMQAEIQRNQTASHMIDVLKEQGHAQSLVNADDVQFRREMYRFLSDTKEGKNMVDGLVKKYGKQLRALQSEVDRLNKEGLDISLGIDRTKKGKTDAFRYKNNENLVNPTAIGTRTQRSIGAAREVSGTIVDQQAIEGGVKASDVRQYIKDLLRQDPQELVRVKNKLGAREPRLKALIKDVEQLKNESEAFRTARKEAWEAAIARADQGTARKNTLRRIVDGITEVYQVPRDIKEIADNITPFQLGTLGKIVAAPQRTLRAGATGLSAPFTVANYVKDQIGVAVLSKDLAASSLKPQNAISGLWNATKDTLGESNDPLWKKFIESSGDTTGYDFLRNAKSAKKASREIRLGKAGKYANMAGAPIRTLEELNSITEKATRFQNFKGVYEKALKQTGNEAEALRTATLAAWQNSVDFSRMGSTAQAINLIIPYFNAGIQGTRLLGRRLAENPVSTTMKALSFVALPMAGLTLYNLSDEKRKAVYDNISDYEKENNFIIVLPNAEQKPDGSYDGVIKIPIQQGVVNLAQPFRMQAENFAKQSNTNDVSQMAQQFFGAFSGPIDTNSLRGFGGSITPQVAKPFVQQAMNKDLFTGKEIVPDYINNATDAQGNPVAEKDKAYPFTSGTARAIGGKLGVSPLRVEKFIKDVTAKTGLYALNTSDNVLAKFGKIPDEQIGGLSVKDDIIRRFARAQGTYNFKKSEGGKYYDLVKEATKGLNGNEKAAWDSIHPSKTNFLGEEIFDPNKRLAKYTKAGLYLQNPKVFAAEKAIEMEQRKKGNPANPLYDLPQEQLAKVLLKDALPPGAKDPELSNLFKEEWYQDYKNKQSSYYTKLKASLEAQGKSFPVSDNPYPETSPELQKDMDYYSSLPKGTGARSSFIKGNPKVWAAMTSQWQAVDDWENKERVKIGLNPIDSQDSSSGSSSGYSKFGYSRSGKSGGSSKKEKTPKTYIGTLLGDAPSVSSNEISIKTAPTRAKFKVKTPSGKGRNYKKIKLG